MYNSYINGDRANELFHWFLTRADRDDLEAIKRDDRFSGMEPEFQQAVGQAFKTVSSDARPGVRCRERLAIMEHAIGEYIHKDLLKIVDEYYFVW